MVVFRQGLLELMACVVEGAQGRREGVGDEQVERHVELLKMVEGELERLGQKAGEE
jgi:hypothetical protein